MELAVGDRLQFGMFVSKDGVPTPLDWIVFRIEENKARIINVNMDLFMHEYLDDESWKDSSLRRWLNNDIYESIFSRKEQDCIIDTKGLPGIGFERAIFEKSNMIIPIERGSTPWNGIMKDAPDGYVFERTITDDTQPGGPVERAIRYYAPFDRCDREKDYKTAWEFFSKEGRAD